MRSLSMRMEFSSLGRTENQWFVVDWKHLRLGSMEALYEATLSAAVLNARASGVETVYLTAVGGGAFGNPSEWILSALERALDLHRKTALDVAIVSFGAPNPAIGRLITKFRATGFSST